VRTSCSNVTLPLSGGNGTPTWPEMKIQEPARVSDAILGARRSPHFAGNSWQMKNDRFGVGNRSSALEGDVG
jgi:hypothetical protein